MDERKKPEEEIPFADSGEFEGYGVPDADAPEGDAGAAEEGAGKEETGEAQTQPEETAEAKKDDANPAEGKDDGGKEAGEEEKPDPLDEIITDFAKVDLGLGDAPVDAAVMEAFGKQCVALKLTPRQAAGLCQFQLQAIEDARKRLTDESCKTLNKEWGKDADKNQQAINDLVTRVDEALGNNEFSQALEASGVTCYAEFAKGLLALVKMTGEDSLGPTASNSGPAKQESALEGIMDAFAKAKGK